MDERLGIVNSILSALLTGGFLMIFIENQKVADSVTDRYYFAMNPFFHSFSNYVKFISYFKNCLTFKEVQRTENMTRLKNNLEKVAGLGGQYIASGEDYPADHFTSEELDSICGTINDIWHCIYTERDTIYDSLDFDVRLGERARGYLEAISPPKYKDKELTKEMLARVSGDFFVEVYRPVQHILPQYESWQQREKGFKRLTFVTIGFTLLTMMLVLLLGSDIPIWVYHTLCIVSCVMLLLGLYKLMQIDNLSKSIMR